MTAHQEGGHMMNLEDQYDRIFKYLYFHFRDRHVAEDMTQEAFLRFLCNGNFHESNFSRIL